MAKLKKGRVKVYICDTCHGNGYVRVAKLDGDPSLDFRDRSEVHQCWDCDSEGEFYETVTDDLIDDGPSNKQDYLMVKVVFTLLDEKKKRKNIMVMVIDILCHNVLVWK
jgi:hypothetical protein